MVIGRTQASNSPPESGQAALPLLLFLVVGVSTVFGSWSVMRLHFRTAERQLALDACVGRTMVELRDLLRFLDSSNLRIGALRASIAAASLQPELLPPLQRWLEAEVAAQDFRLGIWVARRSAWSTGVACLPSLAVLPAAPPDLALKRMPPDPIGPNRLEWIGNEPERFELSAVGRGRSAAAEVRRGTGTAVTEERWTAHWRPAGPDSRFWRH